MKAESSPVSADSEDRRLLERVVAGDRVAFERLYHSYRARLAPFIYRVVRDPGSNEEIFNDVMLAVWRRPAAYNGTSKVSTWIFAIAYRQCLKRLKRGKPGHVSSDGEEAALAAHSEYPQLEREDLLRRALAELSPEHRLVVELSYFRGDSYEEIAQIADCPVNTVKSRMFYARRRLKAILAELDMPPAMAGS